MVLTIQSEEYQLMKMMVLDKDRDEAPRLIKNFVARLEQQDNRGLKSHLDQKRKELKTGLDLSFQGPVQCTAQKICLSET